MRNFFFFALNCICVWEKLNILSLSLVFSQVILFFKYFLFFLNFILIFFCLAASLLLHFLLYHNFFFISFLMYSFYFIIYYFFLIADEDETKLDMLVLLTTHILPLLTRFWRKRHVKCLLFLFGFGSSILWMVMLMVRDCLHLVCCVVDVDVQYNTKDLCVLLCLSLNACNSGWYWRHWVSWWWCFLLLNKIMFVVLNWKKNIKTFPRNVFTLEFIFFRCFFIYHGVFFCDVDTIFLCRLVIPN